MKSDLKFELETLVELRSFNTLNLPCVVDKLVRVKSDQHLISVIEALDISSDNYFILGGGSNIVLPETLSLIALKLEMDELSFNQKADQEWEVVVEAGVVWDDLVRVCVDRGLRGIENLSFIPGHVGAAPVQNIGAYGVELADVLEAVDVYDLCNHQFERLTKDDCCFSYRDSIFKQQPGRYIIMRVVLNLSESQPFNLDYGPLRTLQTKPALSLSDVREKVIAIRQAKIPNPAKLPNSGSFFKNPIIDIKHFKSLLSEFPDIVNYVVDDNHVKLAAGWLIEHAGWKGFREGAVGVHTQQALVLVNYDAAKQADIIDLANKISASIKDKYGIDLEIEPKVLS